MPRDECRDCEGPVAEDSADDGGRCPECADLFEQRREETTTAPLEQPSSEFTREGSSDG